MKKILLFSLLSILFFACNNQPDKQVNPVTSDPESANIEKTIELYIEGSRQGNSSISAQAFAEGATLSGIHEGKFMLVPIQVLYDLVDNNGAQEVTYKIESCSIEKDVAIVRLDAQFGTHKYTDMFTMVKDADQWKIVSKVFHLH